MLNFMFTCCDPLANHQIVNQFIRSIREHMPSSRLIQLADKKTILRTDVDQHIVADWEWSQKSYARNWFHASHSLCKASDIGKSGVVFVDVDMLFTGDVSTILDDEYDVAICCRGDEKATDVFRVLYPYNAGFLVVKNPEFWGMCVDLLSWDLPHKIAFTLDQYIIGIVINCGKFKVKFLDGDIYNRPPASVDEFNADTKVWHFKGHRKYWMLDWVNKHYNMFHGVKYENCD
jgi:hypothetical protein